MTGGSPRHAPRRSAWQRLVSHAARPVSPAPVALLRIGVGGVVALESLRLLWPSPEGSLLDHSFLAPTVALPHPGFEWVARLPELPTRLQVAGIGLAGLLLSLGIVPRLAAGLAALAWTHLWLAEASLYNNHHYLTSLLLLLLACLPLGEAGRWPRASAGARPVPLCTLVVLRLQLALMYFFAGVAKLTPEWWTHSEPLRTQLQLAATRARLASLLPPAWVEWATGELAASVLSRSGALLDLLAGFLLLHRKTRGIAAALLVGFHLTNHFALFDDIGLFPLLGVLSLVVFFPWERQADAARDASAGADGGSLRSWQVAAALAFLAVQILLPLRHFAIPGPVAWTGEGQRFAWRMKAVARRPGQLILRLEDPEVVGVGSDGRAWLDRGAAPDDLALLVEADPFATDAPALPARHAIWTPRVGLRVFARADAEGAAARERLAARWRAIAGGAAVWRPTIGAEPTLERIAGGVAAASDETLERVVQQAGEALQRVASASDRSARRREGARLRAALARLAADPRVGQTTRDALGSGPPWLFAGAPASGEPALYLDTASDFETGRRVLEPGALFIGPGFDDSAASLDGLPRALALRRVDGRIELRWNPVAALTPRQRAKVTTEPDLLWVHAQYVARSWKRASGRRPSVHATARAALVPYREQLLVDPATDLAARKLRWLRHADWIRPLDRDLALR